MGCDLILALGPATVNGHTLFGINCHRPPRQFLALTYTPGRPYACGEGVHTQHLVLPQARQTYGVLGCQAADTWGYQYGLNEHQVVMGFATWQSKLVREQPGLAGPDLVRLGLERSHSARQALELLTDFIGRHGQGRYLACPADVTDQVFVIADPHEAYVVEAAGSYWALQECQDVRAVADVSLVRQDWQRLSPGLAERAITCSWWADDGSKLDFAGSLRVTRPGEEAALKRWGRATRLLEEQDHRIDAHFFRRVLRDHFDGTPAEVDPTAPAEGILPLCQHGGRSRSLTVASLVTELSGHPDDAVVAWCAVGPPCVSVFFPIFLVGELPRAFAESGIEGGAESLGWRFQQLLEFLNRNPSRWALVQDCLTVLQNHFDQEAEELCHEARQLKQTGNMEKLHRLANLLMQSQVNLFEAELEDLHAKMGRRLAFSHVGGPVE